MADRYHRAPGGGREAVLRGRDGCLLAADYRLVNRFPPGNGAGRRRARHGILRRRPGVLDDPASGSRHAIYFLGFREAAREAGLLGSMGTVGDCYDNAMMESFWGTMQLELLDRKKWESRKELANAILNG